MTEQPPLVDQVAWAIYAETHRRCFGVEPHAGDLAWKSYRGAAREAIAVMRTAALSETDAQRVAGALLGVSTW